MDVGQETSRTLPRMTLREFLGISGSKAFSAEKPEILKQFLVHEQLPETISQLRVLRRRAVRAALSRSPAMGNGASAATAMAAAVF